METDHQTSLTFFSLIESVKATIFLKDTSLSTEKGGSWVNVKSDLNWPGAQYNLEITEIQPHLKTTVSPPDCPTSNHQVLFSIPNTSEDHISTLNVSSCVTDDGSFSIIFQLWTTM